MIFLCQAIWYQGAEHARLGSRFSHTQNDMVTAMGRKQLLINELFDAKMDCFWYPMFECVCPGYALNLALSLTRNRTEISGKSELLLPQKKLSTANCRQSLSLNNKGGPLVSSVFMVFAQDPKPSITLHLSGPEAPQTNKPMPILKQVSMHDGPSLTLSTGCSA